VQGLEWGEDYRPLGRRALAEFLEGRMEEWLDGQIEAMAVQEAADRRNGHYLRHLLTELGDLELSVPRTRRFSAVAVLRAYAPPGFPRESARVAPCGRGPTIPLRRVQVPTIGAFLAASRR
jgi:hypothetical protein